MIGRVVLSGPADARGGGDIVVRRGTEAAGEVVVGAQYTGSPARTLADRPDGGCRSDEQGDRGVAGDRREQGGPLADTLLGRGTGGDREGASAGGNHGGKDSREQAKLRGRIIEATTQTTPADATHWSCRSVVQHLGTTHSLVNRVWRSHGLKPYLIRTCKLSNDKRFEEKL